MKGWIAVAGAALLCACAAQDEGVEVEKLKGGGYRLTLTDPDLRDELGAQKALLPVALQLCAGGEVRFGPNAFGRGKRGPQLVQDLTCGPPPPPAAAQPAAAPPAAFTPTAADEQAIAELSNRFLEIRRSGDAAAAEAMFDPASAYADMAAWTKETSAFNSLSGAETKRALTRVSWFENPPSAPAPGVYAAVDYMREFSRVKTACGFIVWRRQADGGWKIDREQLRYLTPEQEARIRRADLPEARAQLGCR